MDNLKLKLGMKFANISIYRAALREHAIHNWYDFKFVKNEGTKVTVVYKQECGWRIHASPFQMTSTFQIKSMKDAHSCPRSYNNKQATFG